MPNSLSFISYNCGKGAQLQSCALGPKILQEWGLSSLLQKKNILCQWVPNVALPLCSDDALYDVTAACEALYKQIFTVLDQGNFPVTLGGDHSMAVGTWSGIVDYYNAKQRLGLIWIDAHLDAHTPHTSPSGAIHGMPAANLLGYGQKQLVDLGSVGRKIAPEHLVYIGVRSYEPEEYKLLTQLGVAIFTMQDVIEQGFDVIMQKALHHVTQHTDGFGVTIDLDAFDPEGVPGVGSPECNGLRRADVFAGLRSVGHHKALRGVEIAEYNPLQGHDDITKKVIHDLIEALFT